MNGFLNRIKRLVLLLLILATGEAVCQSDSLSISQGVDKAEAMMEKDFPKAMALSVELNRLAEVSSCRQCKGRTNIMLGKAYWYNGEYSTAVDYLKQGIKIAQRSADSLYWAKATNMIGNCFYYQAYYDSAIVYFQQSLSIYELTKNKAGVIVTLRDISLMYHRKGDYKNTVEYIIRGEEMSDGQHTPTGIADFPGMGNFFSDSLYYREKISDNLYALKQQLAENNLEATSQIYLNLGLAYNQLSQHLTAARYYVKGYTIKETLGQRPQWDMAGVNYRDANMKDSSLYYHHKAKLSFERETQLTILYTYELLGDAFFHFGEFDSALYNYKIAMKMNVDCNNRITIAGIHRRLVDVYTKLGRYDEAEEQIHAGIELAAEVAMAHRRNLYKSATNLYSLTGDYQKAFAYQNQYTNLADSLARMETALNLTRLLVQYKTSKKEREIGLLKIENELTVEKRNIIIRSLTVVVLTSIVFIAVFARQRNRINKKSKALDFANKEQVTMMKEIHHRVKNNIQLIASLINLQSTHIANPAVAQELEKTRSRIMSIALIHQKLYQHESLSAIDLQNFLESLIENILSTLPQEMFIEKQVDIESVKVEIETAISIGLIVNELITNSIKHGLKTISPKLSVHLVRTESKIILTVHDNGPGNNGLNPAKSEGGFGLRLIEILLKRFSGTIETSYQNGTHTRIELAHRSVSLNRTN